MERLCTFQEVLGVENAPKQKIVAAVEPQYLQAMQDSTTGCLNGTIAQVMRHLFHVNRKVTPQVLFKQEQKVQNMVYDPQHLEAAQTLYSQPQCINLAYRILNCTGLFQQWILNWNKKPQVQKTWMNFKAHFLKAHQQLKETSNLQAQDCSYHANTIQDVLQELRAKIQSVIQVTIPQSRPYNLELPP